MVPAEQGFVAYASGFIERMRAKDQYDAARKQEVLLRSFLRFLGDAREVAFRDFDSGLMKAYQHWLQDRNLSYNSVSAYIRGLKKVYEQAVAQGIAVQADPFAEVHLSYRAKKNRTGLNLDELRRLHRLDLSAFRRSVPLARDMFLFAVYARGMAGGDLLYLEKKNIRDGALVYSGQTAGRPVCIPWEPVLREIADRYRTPGTPYLFPFITETDPEKKWKQHVLALQRINRNLHKIGRLMDLPFTLNMTVARHSWESMVKSVSVGDLIS